VYAFDKDFKSEDHVFQKINYIHTIPSISNTWKVPKMGYGHLQTLRLKLLF